MRIQKDNLGFDHYHAYTVYKLVGWKHYVELLRSVIEFKLRDGQTLTVHFPYELLHTELLEYYRNGVRFVKFGEWLKKVFKIKLYWENAPWLNVGVWDLKFRSKGMYIANSKVDLCLDVGHLMLGCENPMFANALIRAYIDLWGDRIKHLHLHENDLIHDKHWHTQEILTPAFVKEITKGRTFIWEKGL